MKGKNNMYTKERIEDVLILVLKHYKLGDSSTQYYDDKNQKEKLVENVLMELDNEK